MKRQLTITAAEWASIRTEGDPATFSATGGRMVRTLWLVARGNEHWLMAPDEPKLISATPPVEFVQACAPCETCGDQRIAASGGPGYFKGGRLHHLVGGQTVMEIRCPNCRIELVGPCPNCPAVGKCAVCGDKGIYTNGTVILGHAYAVGQPLPIRRQHPFAPFGGAGGYVVAWSGCVQFWTHGEVFGLTGRLAHYGPPESLVGRWALQLAVVGS